MRRPGFSAVKFLTGIAFFLSLAAASAEGDRVLDFSSGCKLYVLQNKAWVPTDSKVLQGWEVHPAQIVKDEKFTVFRAAGGTYGVNQACVTASGAPAPPAAKPAQKRTKRAAAAPKEESSFFNGRGPWAAAFYLGMNLSPSATRTLTGAVTQPATAVKLKNTISFMGEASYRSADHIRFVLGMGLSQFSQDAATGNETSFFYVRPEIPFRVGTDWEVYLGPTLGLFFLSQNASNDTVTGTVLKEQTASSVLLGAATGVDYALSPQFDAGLALQYSKPGTLKVDGTVGGSAFQSMMSVSFFTIAGRFVIHF
jgi:hypothetical protein